MVGEGSFREDLLYRINTIHLEIPPLRERREDIEPLALHFLQQYCQKYEKNNLTFSRDALQKLTQYGWPGNIRELQHAVEKAVILSKEDVITGDEFTLTTPATSPTSFTGTLEDMEKRLIRNAIERNAGNMSAVAAELGITRQTLYNKVKKYEL